jgi:deoxycytidylate deaminase
LIDTVVVPQSLERLIESNQEIINQVAEYSDQLSKSSLCQSRGCGIVGLDENLHNVVEATNGMTIDGRPCGMNPNEHNGCVHDAVRLIEKTRAMGILFPRVVVSNYSPCPSCAALLVQQGVRVIVFKWPYHDLEGIIVAIQSGIMMWQSTPRGLERLPSRIELLDYFRWRSVHHAGKWIEYVSTRHMGLEPTAGEIKILERIAYMALHEWRLKILREKLHALHKISYERGTLGVILDVKKCIDIETQHLTEALFYDIIICASQEAETLAKLM